MAVRAPNSQRCSPTNTPTQISHPIFLNSHCGSDKCTCGESCACSPKKEDDLPITPQLQVLDVLSPLPSPEERGRELRRLGCAGSEA